MTATSPSDMLEPKGDCSPPSPTYVLAPDTIAEITGGGTEDVYDIQVDRTENFNANGLVSHNTRWHQDDPAGRILPENFDGRTGWYKDRTTGTEHSVAATKSYIAQLVAGARVVAAWVYAQSHGGNAAP